MRICRRQWQTVAVKLYDMGVEIISILLLLRALYFGRSSRGSEVIDLIEKILICNNGRTYCMNVRHIQ